MISCSIVVHAAAAAVVVTMVMTLIGTMVGPSKHHRAGCQNKQHGRDDEGHNPS
jgi:hypothetical protein